MSDIVDLLRKSLASNPSDWNVRKAIVEQLFQEGDFAGSADVIREAPGVPPDSETAIRFSKLVGGVDPDCALRLIEGGLSANASDGALHFAKAEILLELGKIAEAGTHYSVAKTFDVQLASAEFEKGLGEAALAATRPAEAAAPVAVEEAPPAEEPATQEPEADVHAPAPEPVPIPVPVSVPEPVPVPVRGVEETAAAIMPDAVPEEFVAAQAVHVEDPLGPEAPVESYSEVVEHVHEVETPVYPDADTAGEVDPATPIHRIPLEELPKLQPLVDPSLVPNAPSLNTGHVKVASPAINFTPHEELMQTRSHLAVFDPSGAVIDADALEDDDWYSDHHEQPGLMVAGEGHIPVKSERDKTTDKVGALLTTILVHVGIALLLWVLVISIPEARPPEIVATTLAPTSEKTVTKKQVARQVQQKPSAPSQNVAQIITAAATSQVSAPTVEFAPETDSVELGTSFGIGVGFGSGGSEAGGTFSFMGNSGSGNRVVFAVDYSASMKSQNREALMKEELAKSVARLPRGSQYQVVFFSGFAFPHDSVKDEWLADPKSWGPRNNNLLQKMRPFGSSGRLGKGGTAADITIPKYSYLEANASNLSKSKKIVEEMPLTYGTNWEHPVIMALSIKPKPDIIFFMTDGAVGDPTSAIEAITALNKQGKPAVINTTAMMEPKAARELGTLAAKNGGKFTIVMKDGTVVKGADFFKK